MQKPDTGLKPGPIVKFGTTKEPGSPRCRGESEHAGDLFCSVQHVTMLFRVLPSPARLPGHFAAEDVKAKLNELNQKWESLKSKASQRRQDLEDSLQAQQYFADANEAESWMREKEPIVGSTDYGKDEDSAEVTAWGMSCLPGRLPGAQAGRPVRKVTRCGRYSVIIVKGFFTS